MSRDTNYFSVGADFKAARVCAELHANGEPHLHALLLLHGCLQTRNPRYFDIEGYHCNMQAARSAKAVSAYIKKGGDFIDDGDVGATGDAEARRDNRSDRAAKLLAEGGDLNEVAEQMPGFFLLNKRKIEEMEEWHARKKRRNGLKKLPTIMEDPEQALAEGWTPAEIEVATWLDANLDGKPRPLKTPQLYLWGPPDVGKTTLVQTLKRFKSVYTAPQDEEFYDHFSEKETDLIVFDEFKGSQKTLQWMNSFLDGQELSIRKKGLQAVKTKNLPVIVLSNFSPNQAYQQASTKGSTAFQAFLTRLCIVNLQSYAEKLIADLERAAQIASSPSTTVAAVVGSNAPSHLDSTISSKNTLSSETSTTGIGLTEKKCCSETGAYSSDESESNYSQQSAYSLAERAESD